MEGLGLVDRKFKALLAPPRRQPPLQRSLPATMRARGGPPERPGARRSTVQRGFGWAWTGATGWDRVGPLGVLGRLAEAGGLFADCARAASISARNRARLCARATGRSVGA